VTQAGDAADVIEVAIVGGGVAGLSAAALLAPHARVTLLERESLLSSHASGSNAAIHRPLEHDVASARLAQRSRELLAELVGDGVLDRTGLCLVSGSAEPVNALVRAADAANVRYERLERAGLERAVPWLERGQVEHGILLLDGGVLDLHRLTSALARRARDHGAQLRTNADVAAVEYVTNTRRVCGVRLRDGELVRAQHVVIAAGAWSAGLGDVIGMPLPLTPMRRHLVQLRAAVPVRAPAPVLWRLEDEVYFRPESGGILCSPCDERAWPAEVPQNDPSALLMLAQKLERTAPALASAAVQRAWACLRTFAPDRELAIGADPRAQGLHWLGGLGGRGMSVAPAAAEILTQQLLAPKFQVSPGPWSIARLLPPRR
jgi:D-arginine dehydrogenase